VVGAYLRFCLPLPNGRIESDGKEHRATMVVMELSSSIVISFFFVMVSFSRFCSG
jgi:hypothetical protein